MEPIYVDDVTVVGRVEAVVRRSEPRLVAGFGWLEGRVAPFAKRFGNAPAVLALREALPISFGGLLIALGVLIVFFEHGDFVVRLKNGIPGAFAVMSIVLLLVLAVRLAQRLELPIVAMLAAAMCAFGLALPRAVWKSFTALAATLGTSGLFTVIVCCLARPVPSCSRGAAFRVGPERCSALP